MLYLITAQAEDFGGLMMTQSNNYPETISNMINTMINPSFEIMAEWEKSGKIKGGVIAGARGGAFIMDANSNDEVANMLSSLPFWGIIKWEIKPLQSYRDVIEQNKRNMENMRKNFKR